MMKHNLLIVPVFDLNLIPLLFNDIDSLINIASTSKYNLNYVKYHIKKYLKSSNKIKKFLKYTHSLFSFNKYNHFDFIPENMGTIINGIHYYDEKNKFFYFLKFLFFILPYMKEYDLKMTNDYLKIDNWKSSIISSYDEIDYNKSYSKYDLFNILKKMDIIDIINVGF